MARVRNNAKEWMWKQIWNKVEGQQYTSMVDGSEFLDPKAIFYCQIEDTTKPFTIYHFITHMEYMREKLPQREFEKHRDWVFNNHPRTVPSFKELFREFLKLLIGCFSRFFMRV